MARVTVEDCLERVENRFALVLIAAQRTRQIIKGAPTLLEVHADNKEAVIALREVAAGLIPYEIEAAPSEEQLEEAVKVLSHSAPEPADLGPTTSQLFAGLLDNIEGPAPGSPASQRTEPPPLDEDAPPADESSATDKASQKGGKS